MKVIIAGSRGIVKYDIVEKAINWCIEKHGLTITEIVSGTARGVDKLGESWAVKNGVLVKRFPADWSRGISAGHIRNRQMGDYANALIALWDGTSSGTEGMIEYAKEKGLLCFIFIVENNRCKKFEVINNVTFDSK